MKKSKNLKKEYEKKNSNIENLLVRARISYQNKKYLIALQDVYKILHIEPDNIAALSLLRDIYLDSDRYKEAKQVSDRLVQIDESFDSLLKHGRILIFFGFLPEALEYLQKAETLDSSNPELLFSMGFVLLNLNETDRALKYLMQLWERGIYFKGLGLFIGEILYEKFKIEDAILVLERSLQYEEDNLDIIGLLGDCHLQLSHWSSALWYYKLVEKIRTNDYKLMRSIGWVLCNMNSYTEGIRYLKKAISINPDYIEGFITLAIVYLNLNKQKLAYDLIKKVREKDPDNEFVKKYIRLFDDKKE